MKQKFVAALIAASALIGVVGVGASTADSSTVAGRCAICR
ncbi:hypothetical protein ATK17_3913 [Branchiibius hedensis]|uniref:Uncharacterized protein n=1 Tax=Branchiibius hedensis TaxID=672460 RepID=A0A2Y9BMW1_9MICO|nr:hypothetical protein ATK17_3913 [Branchiibius hedensis]SSA59098.1 hypothetical protein SAMN04489750_3913 [Branchiibius hedensis]